jgi:hypothetical protein
MSRMGLMLTIPSPPFGSSWHSLARFPIFPFHTKGQRHERGKQRADTDYTRMPASSSPSPAACPALPPAPRSRASCCWV